MLATGPRSGVTFPGQPTAIGANLGCGVSAWTTTEGELGTEWTTPMPLWSPGANGHGATCPEGRASDLRRRSGNLRSSETPLLLDFASLDLSLIAAAPELARFAES